jgi:hypothetical protein
MLGKEAKLNIVFSINDTIERETYDSDRTVCSERRGHLSTEKLESGTKG